MVRRQKFEFDPTEYKKAMRVAKRLQRELRRELAGNERGIDGIGGGKMKVVDIQIPATNPNSQFACEIANFAFWKVVLEYNHNLDNGKPKRTTLALAGFIKPTNLYAIFREAFEKVEAPIAVPYFKLVQRSTLSESVQAKLFDWAEDAANLDIVKLSVAQEIKLGPAKRSSRSVWRELQVSLDEEGLYGKLEPHRIHYRQDKVMHYGADDVCDSVLAAYIEPVDEYYPIAHIGVGQKLSKRRKGALSSVDLMLAPGVKNKTV